VSALHPTEVPWPGFQFRTISKLAPSGAPPATDCRCTAANTGDAQAAPAAGTPAPQAGVPLGAIQMMRQNLDLAADPAQNTKQRSGASARSATSPDGNFYA
jgi:hypothetical protein